MKRHLYLPVACALSLLSTASAQLPLTSSTPVIGFYKFDVPVGTSAWTCGLVTKKQFQGEMSATAAGATKSTITVASPVWTPGAFTLHYVEILSGPQEGLVIDIDPTTPNTATEITVIGKTTGANSLGLTGNESFCIRRHATLGSIFKNGAGLQPFSDLVTVLDETGLESVYGFDGAQWVDGSGFTVPSNDTIIYPGQGFFITSGAVATLTFGGDEVAYVRGGPLKVPVYGGKRNLVGIVSPLVSTNPLDPLYAASSVPGSALGLVNFLNPFSDIINTFSADGLLSDAAVFGSDGTNLVDGTTFSDNRNATPFRNGSVFAVTPPADTLYTQPSLTP